MRPKCVRLGAVHRNGYAAPHVRAQQSQRNLVKEQLFKREPPPGGLEAGPIRGQMRFPHGFVFAGQGARFPHGGGQILWPGTIQPPHSLRYEPGKNLRRNLARRFVYRRDALARFHRGVHQNERAAFALRFAI